jgi:hypothetical protein
LATTVLLHHCNECSDRFFFFFLNIETLNFVKISKKSSYNNEKSDDAPKSWIG